MCWLDTTLDKETISLHVPYWICLQLNSLWLIASDVSPSKHVLLLFRSSWWLNLNRLEIPCIQQLGKLQMKRPSFIAVEPKLQLGWFMSQIENKIWKLENEYRTIFQQSETLKKNWTKISDPERHCGCSTNYLASNSLVNTFSLSTLATNQYDMGMSSVFERTVLNFRPEDVFY